MPDLSFLEHFANNPITLSMLMITSIVIFFIWKGLPFIKDLKLGIFDRLDTIDKKVDDIKENDSKQEEKLNNITKDILRITIYQDNLTIPERLLAARRYFDVNGNGQTKKYVEEKLIKDNEELWHSIKQLNFENSYFIKEKELN